MSKKYFAGCLPDPPDSRDYALSSYLPTEEIELPDTYTVPYLSPVRNQGSLGACVAFGTAVGMKEAQEAWELSHRHKGPSIIATPKLSPLDLYRNCKLIDGMPNEEGTWIRCAMKVLKDTGVCLESCRKYAVRGNVKPCKDCNDQRNLYKIKTYAKVEADFDEIKRAIFNFGGVVAGLHTNLSWSRTQSGIINYLGSRKRTGGHCIFFTGWNLTYMIFKNSWGTSWGKAGYGYLTKEYIENEMISAYTAVDA